MDKVEGTYLRLCLYYMLHGRFASENVSLLTNGAFSCTGMLLAFGMLKDSRVLNHALK